MNFKITLANLIKWLHNLILVVALIGWAIFTGDALKYYLGFNIVIVVQWIFNENRCVLTQWESVLRGGTKDLAKNSESTFMGQVFHKILGYYPSYEFINYSGFGLMFLFSGLGLIKLYFF